MQDKNHARFTGRSGQLAVMAEFLIRGTNVAIPEVDVGDDIVVVRDEDDVITRVQVKTAHAIEKEGVDSFDAQFKIPMKQLEDGPINLVYAFVVRRDNCWAEFVLIHRSVLNQLHVEYGALSGINESQTLRLSFERDRIRYKGFNFQPFRDCFTPWPPADVIPDGVLPIPPSKP